MGNKKSCKNYLYWFFITHIDFTCWCHILIGWIIIIIIVLIGITYGYGSILEIGDGVNAIKDLYQTNTIQTNIEIGSELLDRGIEHLKNNAEKLAEDNQN